MKKSQWNWAVGGAFGLLLAAAPEGFAQDAADPIRLKADIARAQRELRRIDADIRRADSLRADEEAAAARGLERRQRERERREKENQALAARAEETRGRIASERARQQGSRNGMAELEAGDKALLRLLAGFADSLLLRVENSLPWDQEPRRERLLSLKRDLDAGSASPEEGFSRLSALLREEIKAGDEVALFNRPVTRQNGEVVNAQLLKLGNQALLYMDDEGKHYGSLERERGENGIRYAWREDLPLAERNAVKRALAVKAGREAPQLVLFDLSLALDSAAAPAAVPARESAGDPTGSAAEKGGR